MLPEDFQDDEPEVGIIADNCDAESATCFIEGDLDLSILDELLPPEIRLASSRGQIEDTVAAHRPKEAWLK